MPADLQSARLVAHEVLKGLLAKRQVGAHGSEENARLTGCAAANHRYAFELHESLTTCCFLSSPGICSFDRESVEKSRIAVTGTSPYSKASQRKVLRVRDPTANRKRTGER